MRRFPLLALTLVLSPAAGGARPPETASAPPALMTVAEASALAARIVPVVEELRGAKFERPVPVKVVDDAAARSYFQARLGRLLPESRLDPETGAYAALGLLPSGMDVRKALFDLLEEQAGGYYDPETGTFFVLADMPASIGPVLVAHELTHALDDQHYRIDALIEKVLGDADRENAVSAVVEGSGTVVMTVFAVREMAAGRMSMDAMMEIQKSEAGKAERLKAAPAILQRSLLGSYVLGAAFLMRGNLAGAIGGVPAADIDRALREPPASTEQILHPDKYWGPGAPDLPVAVALPDLAETLGAGWARLGEGTLGEMMLPLLTGGPPLDLTSPEAALPGRWTNDAASGWGGDRWALYARGPQRAIVLGTVWDTERDASEFASALVLPPGGRARRQGRAVVLVAGDTAGHGDEMVARALEALAGAAGPPSGR